MDKLDIIIEKLGSMDEKIHSMDKKIDSMDEKIHSMDKKIDSMDEKIHSMDKKIHSMDEKIHSMDEKIHSMDEKIHSMDNDIKDIKLTLENEIRTNIMRVAEGHLDLSRNLKEAVKSNNEFEMLAIKVNMLESDVRELKRKIS